MLNEIEMLNKIETDSRAFHTKWFPNDPDIVEMKVREDIAIVTRPFTPMEDLAKSVGLTVDELRNFWRD